MENQWHAKFKKVKVIKTSMTCNLKQKTKQQQQKTANN